MDEDQIAQTLLSAAISRLLGWAGASLATAGITLNFGPDSAAKIASIIIGLALMLAHYLRSKANLKQAISAAPPSTATPMVDLSGLPAKPTNPPTTKP